MSKITRWQAESKDDMIHREVLTMLFNCVKSKGIAYRTLQKTGHYVESEVSEFLSHLLTLFDGVDVLVGLDKYSESEERQIIVNPKVPIADKIPHADKLFYTIKKQMKKHGIFKVYMRQQLDKAANVQKGRDIAIGVG